MEIEGGDVGGGVLRWTGDSNIIEPGKTGAIDLLRLMVRDEETFFPAHEDRAAVMITRCEPWTLELVAH